MTKNEPGINDNEESFFKIQADIEAFEKDAALYEEQNFDNRLDAIDFLEFHIIDHIESLIKKAAQPDQLILLMQRAENIKLALEAIDNNMFKKLRAHIRSNGCTGEQFKKLLGKYIDFNAHGSDHEEAGYDNLDIFINGLLSPLTIPEQTTALEPEMVFYQKTPARIIFELVEMAFITKDDVFFDLGSGLGQASILVNLLAGAKAVGVEFEPAFCSYAGGCAVQLNLPNVSFINADARQADYSDGTVFLMYTPFNGEILQDVLAVLRKESLTRKIKIITYGPCTAQVASEGWLDITVSNNDNIYKPAVFTSI
ncbi:class I SAM-dependent methyltransferase [Mucilaginibacter flavidus]|uniref:class I SAM-dependent methyltransferase n=1 Tax=Mucilaginibacter flavidus TaxID=2949309 RepID=UPI002092EE88|nr:class I SAM-dependent methyltransferase [Mucilaginibacter flavidus]MCO5949791.1 class I SAM-dependent methyltransferase [Mucilaginibacter flavidus]